MRNRGSADAGAAEDDVAVVEDSGLAGGDGALWSVESDARGGGVERLDGGERGFVLVADFYEHAQGGGGGLAGNPVQAFNLAGCLSEGLALPDRHAVLFRVDRGDIEGPADRAGRA